MPSDRHYPFAIRVVTVGLAIGSVLCVATGIGGMQPLTVRLQHGVRLDLAKVQCASYPWLLYREAMYSNLGNVGPDSGNGEGMVIRAQDMGGSDPARFGKDTYLVFNSTDGKYKAADATLNGLMGRFGTFNMPGSSMLNFRLSFRDENWQQLTMKRFVLTFFDLDSAEDKDFLESVAIKGYKEYFTTPQTEVKIHKLSSGLTQFVASTMGTAADDPLNPMAMTQLQKNRVVSLLYENVTEILGSVKTDPGTRAEGLRVFNFASENSLACARDVHEFPKVPLEDLNYNPPTENPVAAPADAIFDAWMVTEGDRVEKGHTLATVNSGGDLKKVKAAKTGTVIARQPLVRGDVVGEKLTMLNIAVIKSPKLAPLPTSEQTSKAAICSADNQYFQKYHVAVGENVKKGDKLATTALMDGSLEQDILAPKDGGIAALQPLEKGDACTLVEDLNLATIGKFVPLSANIGETPVAHSSGDIFKKWLVDVGDAVEEGQPIAVIRTSAGTIQKKSAYRGIVVEQQPLRPGASLDEALPEETLVLVRSDGRLRPLNTSEGEASAKAPKAAVFVAWTKQVGDHVVAGEAVANFSDEPGQSIHAAAPKSGTVTAIVKGLKPGDKLDNVMSSDALATINDKLRPLTVWPKEGAIHVPENNMIFKEWLKLVGQTVAAGETICVLEDNRGNLVNVTAEEPGIVVAEQDLRPNDVIDGLVDNSPSVDGVRAQVLAVIDFRLRRMQARDGENASSWKDGMLFKEWNSRLGDNVTEGQTLATLDNDGVAVAVRAPTSGFITAVQEGLTEGTVLTKHPSTIATIADKFRPLKVLYGEKGHDAEEGDMFGMFLVTLGEEVQYGQSLASVTTKDGKLKDLKCKRAGLVVALQDPLRIGMKINEVMYDQNLAVTATTLRTLEVRREQDGVNCSKGSTFKAWVNKVGDQVEKGDVIAKVHKADGTVEKVLAPRRGIITDHQKGLKEGMNIDKVTKDRNLAVIADEVGPLASVGGEEVISVPPGCRFKKWQVNVSDTIKKRDPVATLETKDGQDLIVRAPRSGVVKSRQEGLREGMDIDKACVDDSLIVMGKLPALTLNEGMAPVMAPEGYFQEWIVDVGDEVKEGDPVAIIKHKNGETELKRAPKSGTVHSRQEHLTLGCDLATTLEGGDICVIGRFTEMKPTWTERTVDAPPEAVFKKWHAKKDQQVDFGDLIATVAIPRTRPLEVGRLQRRRLETEWEIQQIKAPKWGTVTDEQPMLPGMTIGDQQVGSSIATIDSGPPWWIWLLCILAILCCCLCCLFYNMKKAIPLKQENQKQPVPEHVELGLDFDDGGKIIRVLPNYRPLGIRRDHEAPIVVKEFTVNSYAKSELKIQKGWKLVAINGEQLNESTDFAWVSKKLGAYMKDFPIWPLTLEFRTKANKVVSHEFQTRPIGVELGNRAPIRVSSVVRGSPAEEQGIKPGMLLIKIAQEDVSVKRPYKDVLNLLKEAVTNLDTVDDDQKAVVGQDHVFDVEGGHTTWKKS